MRWNEPIMRPPTRNGSLPWEIARGMADASLAVTRWLEGSRKSFPSTFIFPVAHRRPLRFCRHFSPCSIERPKPPLRLEALETTDAAYGRRRSIPGDLHALVLRWLQNRGVDG